MHCESFICQRSSLEIFIASLNIFYEEWLEEIENAQEKRNATIIDS